MFVVAIRRTTIRQSALDRSDYSDMNFTQTDLLRVSFCSSNTFQLHCPRRKIHFELILAQEPRADEDRIGGNECCLRPHSSTVERDVHFVSILDDALTARKGSSQPTEKLRVQV